MLETREVKELMVMDLERILEEICQENNLIYSHLVYGGACGCIAVNSRGKTFLCIVESKKEKPIMAFKYERFPITERFLQKIGEKDIEFDEIRISKEFVYLFLN